MMNSPTCPTCSGQIPPVIAAAPFCPWCGRERAQAPGAGKPKDARDLLARLASEGHEIVDVAPRRQEIFSESYYNLCLGFDPQVGFALVGVHAPDGETARLRAYDLYNKRVAWESLSGEDLSEVDHEKLAIRGHNVYVSIGRTLRALDLFTGRQKWGAELSDELKYVGGHWAGSGLDIVDATPPGHPGALLAFTTDNVVVSLDRDTGRLLWKEKREHMPRSAQPIEQSGLVLIETNSQTHDVMNPAQQAPISRIQKSIESFSLVGRYGIWEVEHWGWRDREGIALYDYLVNQELMFEAIDKVEDDVPYVMGFNRVYCATEYGEKICYAPNGVPTVVREGHRIKQLAIVGPTLFVLMAKHEGTRVRRVLGLDPQNLTVRFDLGELSTEPNDHESKQILVLPELAVIVNSRDRDDDHCELWGVTPTGQVLWRTYVGEWQSHWFMGGHIVCFADGYKVLRPNDGQIVMEYKRDW